MKIARKTLPAFILILSFFFQSCKEDFSPYDFVGEKDVLNCAFTVYPSEGFNVYTIKTSINRVYYTDINNAATYKIDPSVKWAVVNLAAGTKNYVMQMQRVIDKSDSLNIDTQYVYSASGVEIKGGYKLSISAKLPDGKVLSSSTQVPSEFEVVMSYPFEGGFSSKISRFLWGNALTFSWKTTSMGHLYFPKFEIFYSDSADGMVKSAKIPEKYINREGNWTAMYPSAQYIKSVSFDYDAVDSVMANLARKDPERKIQFYYLQAGIIEYDAALSNYYSSLYGKLDRFSIRLDDAVYSNISGGIGVFGVGCISKTRQIEFRDDYLESFGYKYVEHSRGR